MKLFLIFISLLNLHILYGQDFWAYPQYDHNNNLPWHRISLIDGIFHSKGNVTSLYATTPLQPPTQYSLSFLRTEDYRPNVSTVYTPLKQDYFPLSIAEVDGYFYIVTEDIIQYGLLKIDSLGNFVSYKKMTPEYISMNLAKVQRRPNTSEILLIYDVPHLDQIMVRSIDANLSSTDIAYKIQLQRPNSYYSIRHIDVLVIDSTLHYSILYGYLDNIFETGKISLNSGNVLSTKIANVTGYCTPQNTKIIQSKNDTTYYLLNHSLVVSPDTGNTFHIYHPSIHTRGIDIVQTENGDWILAQNSTNQYANSIGHFNIHGNDNSYKTYTAPVHVTIKKLLHSGNTVLTLGATYNGILTLDEFEVENIGSCHNRHLEGTIAYSQINTQEVQITVTVLPALALENAPKPLPASHTYADSNYCHPGTVSIKDTETENISIHPNPTTDIVHIHNAKEHIKEILLYDLSGKRISGTKAVNQHNATLHLSHLSAGAYMIKVHTQSGVYTKKVIKY